MWFLGLVGLCVGWVGGFWEEELVEFFGAFGLHVWEDVAVGVEGEGDAGVAEAFADDFGVDAGLEHEGGVGVA